jgi:UDP-N-acetylmuramate dehydrogenase
VAKEEQQLKELLGEELKSNVILRDYTSMKVGGVADFFYEARTVDELVKGVSAALTVGIPYFILAGGYNVVISDIGYPGLVIRNLTSGLVFLPGTAELIADGGLSLPKLISESASRDLGGLEYLFGVPGTVGGAVYGNAGALEHSIGESVRFVTLLIPNPKTRDYRIVKYKADWFDFSYRLSKLKEHAAIYPDAPRPVILTVKLQLAKGKSEIILDRMRKNLALKKSKQPVGEYNSGSFFMNPGNVKEQSAGFLLDQVGAKKMKIGKAAVSKKHANFIVNKGNAKAEDIRRLAEQLKIKVRDEYRVNLKEEIEYVGRW